MAFGARILWLSLSLGILDSTCHARTVLPRDAVPKGFEAIPYYPAPHGGWAPSWKDAYAKAQALVSQMTLAEKTNITSGAGMYMGKPACSIQNILLWYVTEGG
jgi:beta-glucosidase